MGTKAIYQQLGGVSSYRLGEETYDSTKLGLGKLMIQKTGGTNAEKWAGPLPIGLGRPFEASTAISVAMPWAMQWNDSPTVKTDWIFAAENSTAAATRRLVAYEYNRLTGANPVWKGYITVTFPTATNHTVRGFRMTYHKFTTGTVGVSGTAVTGSGTGWTTNRVPAGCRIGFGSTDPTAISTWYYISSIGSDTGITLTTSAGTISSGTSYVIEDLRAVIMTTNATATNGGLFIVKGISIDDFSPTGVTISAATTTDNVKACYWLKDAATITNTTANGCGLESGSYTSQMCWVGNGTTTMQLFKHDIRAALTLASGAATNQYKYATGVSATLTGTASQVNNGRIATLSHGPGSGTSCYYFTTTTRVYRTIAMSSITTGSTTFISGGDNMTEVYPGGASTSVASSLMNSVEYASSIDKLVIAVNATTTPFRSYITQYRTDGGQFDRVFGADTRQNNQSAASGDITPTLYTGLAAYTVWSEGGLTYILTNGTAAATNFLYVVPFSADWEYAATTGSRIITPAMTTTDCDKFVNFAFSEAGVLGGATGQNLGMSTEHCRCYYRTSGITDNSGSWTLIDAAGDLSGVGAATSIQFMFEFRTIGFTNVTTRLHSYVLAYNDNGMDAHYEAANIGTNLTSKTFGFWFKTAFGSTVPRLEVELLNAVTGASLGTDDSTTKSWTWEKSTNDGGAWAAYNTTDRANDTTYIRITPTSLADNIKVRPILRLY